MDVLYHAVVGTARDPLNVRDSPDAVGRKIGDLPRGATVDVLAQPCEGWLYVRWNGVTGYASAAYLVRQEEEDGAQEEYTTLRRSDGIVIRMAGRWSVAED